VSYETTSGGPTGPLPQGSPQQPQQAGPQTQQMPYPPQQAYGQYGGQGYGQRNGHDVAEQARRYVHTPETKEFFRTSEFVIWLVMTICLFIAAAVHNNFSAEQAWPLAIGLSAAYILSRGIAKSGARRGEERDFGRYESTH
jgi:glycerol uptake facilitator-like aquaporin